MPMANCHPLNIVLILLVGEGVAFFLDNGGGDEPENHPNHHEGLGIGQANDIEDIEKAGDGG